MTTSGEYVLDLSTNAIITEAYEILQATGDGETLSGNLYNAGVSSLNRMLKLWESQGIHLWTETEGSLFLKVDVASYDYRDEGFEGVAADTTAVHLANAFTQRASSALRLAGQPVITLADTTDLAIGSQIGLMNDSNDLDWYIAVEVGVNTVVVSRDLDNDLVDGAVVYTYSYFNSTTLSIANAGTAILDVNDTTIFSVGDEIYQHLTDDSTDQRTIASIDEGAGTITLTVALTSPSGLGEETINITTRSDLFKPIKRILNDQVRRRESTDYEIPIVFQSRKDYFDLPNKNQSGTPIQAYYSRQQPQGIMYLWNPPSSAQSIINFTYERSLMIVTAADQTFDIPSEWYDALVYQLAKRLMHKVGCSATRRQEIRTDAEEYLDNALGFDQAVYPIRLKPQQYG